MHTLRHESRWGRAIAVAALAVTTATTGAAAQSGGDFVPVTDAMLQDPAPGDWLTWRRTLDGWGYSPVMSRHVRMVAIRAGRAAW